MKMSVRGLLLATALALVSTAAQAEIYKYKRADGTVTYTDRLSDLPEERRVHYNRLQRERDEAMRSAEQRLGKEEVARRLAERERKELGRKKLASDEYARRKQAIDARLAAYRESSSARDKSRTVWQKRAREARSRLVTQLKQFRAAEKTYQQIAVRAGFTLLPGQAEQRDKAKRDMIALERKIDATLHEVQVVIPTAARKAGIPPGWIR